VASAFALLPAIDLVGGRVVRLEQGDFERQTTFSTDPVDVAMTFAGEGARWLHVVDLDGARSGRPAHRDVVREIMAATGPRVRVELAGGLRSLAAIDTVIAMGVARVVLGTAVLADQDFASTAVAAHGADHIAVAIDVRGGIAVGEGWRQGAPGSPAADAIRTLADRGVTTFEVTSIARDGLRGGPDLELLGRLIALGAGRIIASGGISSIADLAAVRELGCAGAIVGRALYDGALDLASALATAARDQPR
jgi:phosphoribosylformimino-5-aminoimidazole carboxamide ribotide isomerase